MFLSLLLETSTCSCERNMDHNKKTWKTWRRPAVLNFKELYQNSSKTVQKITQQCLIDGNSSIVMLMHSIFNTQVNLNAKICAENVLNSWVCLARDKRMRWLLFARPASASHMQPISHVWTRERREREKNKEQATKEEGTRLAPDR